MERSLKILRVIIFSIILIMVHLTDYASEYVVIPLDSSDISENVLIRALTATLGDSTAVSFKPQLKLSAWGDEGEFTIDLKGDSDIVVDSVSTGTVNNAGSIDIKLNNYIRHLLYKRVDGNLEWEIIFESKPVRNYIEYPIQTKGLIFAYQDTLRDIDTMSFRPDSVIGSYAVYHASRKNNLTRLDGSQEIYNTGKAFHIYRPKVRDSGGDTAWCQLSINTKTGIMTITVPQKFFDEAVYPVTIDPTLGYTTKGASSTYNPANYSRSCLAENMGAVNGTVDSFGVWAQDDGATGTIGWALFSDASKTCNILLDTSTGTVATVAWADSLYRGPSAENYALTASTDYWIAVITGDGSNVNGIKYDDNVGDTSTAGWSGWPPASDCEDGDGYGGWSVSVFIWYTESGGPPPETPLGRRRNVIIKGS